MIQTNEASLFINNRTVSESLIYDEAIKLARNEDTMNTTKTNRTNQIKNNKIRWTKEEDANLMQAVSIHGTKKWMKISEIMSGRSNV